jgi:hypothetical protein
VHTNDKSFMMRRGKELQEYLDSLLQDPRLGRSGRMHARETCAAPLKQASGPARVECRLFADEQSPQHPLGPLAVECSTC